MDKDRGRKQRTDMETRNELTEKFSRLFSQTLPGIRASSFELFNSEREKAMEKFIDQGIPTRKNEAYKYTNLEPLFRHDYDSFFIPGPDDFAKAERFKCDVADLDSHGVILINGFYPTIADKIREIPGGIWIGSLNEAAGKFPSVIEKHFGKYIKEENDSLIHLNTALASDGVFIYVPDGVKLKKPVQIINLVESDKDIFNQHRNLIVVEENSELSLIVCDHTLSPNRFLTNGVTEAYVGENAVFNLIRVQNEHNNSSKITNTFIYQESNSQVSSNNITLHGGLVRNSTKHILAGEGAGCLSLGLYLSDKFQHVDNFVNVEHLVPDCSSNQLFKGVLDDMSTAVFNGRIYVAKDAQRTSAYQRNSTIILTPDAKMNSKPQLEIFADDVKCTHGATVGQLDEEAMFYLQSRGISKSEARLMLMFGFAHEVIRNIPVEPLRQRMDDLVMQRLRGELSRCASCMVKCS